MSDLGSSADQHWAVFEACVYFGTLLGTGTWYPGKIKPLILRSESQIFIP